MEHNFEISLNKRRQARKNKQVINWQESLILFLKNNQH